MRSFSVAVACLSIVGLARAGDVRASITQPTDIPAQALEPALQTFARGRHLYLIYASEDLSALRTHGAVGQFTADQALTTLLGDTGLTYRYIDEKTVTIIPVSPVRAGAQVTQTTIAPVAPDTAPDIKEAQDKSFWDRFRLAQATQGISAESSAVARSQEEDAGGNPAKLEEVIVTAQKRNERLLDVPVSIVAVGSDELQRRQLTTLEDLPFAVPDLAYTKTGNNYLFEIRGISNNSGSSPLVGIYMDEADLTLGGQANTQANLITYDLERVEVLRGPQGTLYGDGSAGGTIRFVTKSPNLNGFAFDSQLTSLFTQHGSPSERINAMVNVPLIENQLGLRIAGTVEHDGGWIDQPAADQKDTNGQDLTNVRVKGLWQPDPRLTISAMAIINRDDRGMDFSDPNAPYSWTQVLNFTSVPRVRNDYDLYNLTVTYDVSSAVRVLNTTSYLRIAPTSWNLGSLFPSAPAGDPQVEFIAPLVRTRDHLLTDELRVTSAGAGPWQWTGGVFYRHYRDKFDVPLVDVGLSGPPGTPLIGTSSQSFETLYKSWSFFGDTSYRIWERLTLGAGIRYFGETQEFSDFVAMTRQTGRFHSTDPRAYAQLKLTSNLNVYASASKGFRSGGFNSIGQPTYAPESVWAYEFGVKAALLDGRISFDAAVFRSNYANYQNFGTTSGATGYYVNAGSAAIKGAEADLTWRPSVRWRLEARGDYLNGRFTEINAEQTAYVVGDPVDLVPRYQFTLSGQRDFSWLGRQGFARLDYSRQGPMTVRNRSLGPWYYDQSGVIQLLNFNTSLMINNNLRVGLVAQNLLNDQGFVAATGNTQNGSRSRPRTFGIDFSVTLD